MQIQTTWLGTYYQDLALSELALAPRLILNDPKLQTIIMSNLKTMGYKMVDKKGGLDMRHLRAVFKELARFHAVGYHMIQNLGEKKFVEVLVQAFFVHFQKNSRPN